jgi:hypothetical protein
VQYAECEDDGALFLAHGLVDLDECAPAYTYAAQEVNLEEPKA